MAKILVPLGKGFEELEAISIIDVLRRAGCQVIIASLKDNLEVLSQGGVKIIADIDVSKVEAFKIDAVVFPGGWEGTENLIECKELRELVLEMDSQRKIIAAICAAPYALFKMGVLKNRNFTCYPSIEKMIDNPNYQDSKNVIHDENIITSKGPATALEFAYYLVKTLVSPQKEKEVKEGMLFI